MPNQARHKNLTFFAEIFAILQKEKKKKREKILGKLSFSVLDVFFPRKKGCHK
jgi:hypothetical protein